MAEVPIFYSFRRCPYAMRARLAIAVAGIPCALREVVLRDKPAEMLEVSPKGTVPVLVGPKGQVLEQSLDIMRWALGCNDPEQWLVPLAGTPQQMNDLIDRADTEFKPNLDCYKYASRHAVGENLTARAAGGVFLMSLNALLAKHSHLFGARTSLADMAIAPFVRQFAQVDQSWFESQPWPFLKRWLDTFLQSKEYAAIMLKYPQWRAGDPITNFPQGARNAS